MKKRVASLWIRVAMLAALAAVGAGVSCAESRPAGWSVSTSARPRSEPTAPTPPAAEKIPHDVSLNGETRIDDYYWLRERDNPKVLAYLEAENAYTKAMTAPMEPLVKQVYDEMLSRIKEDDRSVPFRKGEYFYYTRTEEGKAYPIHCRKQGSLDAVEEVILDENALAEGKDYFRVGVFEVSPDAGTLAYSVDTNGSERYTLYFKDLRTGRTSDETVPDTYYSGAWGNDNRSFFYTTVDAATRPYRMWRHTVGRPAASDAVVYQEDDEKYFLDIEKTRSDKYVLVNLSSMATTEVRFLDADEPTGETRVLLPRRQGVEYSVDHMGDRFFVATNEEAVNFKLVSTPVISPSWESLTEVIGERDDVTITGVDCFKDHLVVYERENGLPTIHVWRMSTGDEHAISFPEQAYDVTPVDNEEFDTDMLRFVYTSLVTPASVFDYNMDTHKRTLLKEQPVLGGYDRTKYITKRIFAKAKDGAEVPISIVYRVGLKKDGKNPTLLYGYGSYGANSDPAFSSNTLSLLDRGFVYAIAHTRGGAEKGRRWYEDGRLMHKRNTFTDFIACAETLIDDGYTSPDHLAIFGGSAGGLLMGAVTNMRPDLFKVVVAAVPFVDVINTMVDPTIPLTVTEWEQWGDPRKADDYAYIRTYSPYDNVKAQAYPNMLVLAGLNDPRVAYWEPAKWTAKLRAMKTNDSVLLLKTNMDAGHGGPSGRYGYLEQRALIYAFIIDELGVDWKLTGGAAPATTGSSAGRRSPRRRRRAGAAPAARRAWAGLRFADVVPFRQQPAPLRRVQDAQAR